MVGLDSSGFNAIHASQYYAERVKMKRRRRRKYIKLSLAADVLLQQIICRIKIRRAPTTIHDIIDFGGIITKTSGILPLSVVTGDKGYPSFQ
ncbi:MAG: hypothetical protein JO297_08855 [Nitrososphaeraceae archaeon]|nr:hypothetical protein [Nitrososphaeraceae archaeon]